MDALEAILSRRSIRRYSRDPVPPETVKLLLEAAMNAPSAGNEQPWHFIVITERHLLDEIPRFHPYADMLREASLAILVCGDTERERYKGHWVQDCSAATQNLLLAAHACGLGAVWVGIYPVEERIQRFRKLLGLPAPVIPLALVPLGHPASGSRRFIVSIQGGSTRTAGGSPALRSLQAGRIPRSFMRRER